MKREIKFRIWDKFKNVFVPSDIFGIVNTDFGAFAVMIKDWENYQEGEYFYPNQHELMQFTGLHDKNGKEIYEGDIVIAWSEGYCHTGEIRWRMEGQPAIIIYPAYANQGFWKLHGSKNEDKTWSDDGVEIIGNIYENPELLQP